MSDVLRVTCPECESTLRVGPKAFGRTVKCPRCQSPIAVPIPPGGEDPPGRSRLNQAKSLSRRGSASAGRVSSVNSSSRTDPTEDFDLGAALEGFDEFEDLPSGEDEEGYEDYDTAPSRKKKSSRREKIDTSVRGVWRDGKILVIAHGAKLPKRCIKTNAPGTKKKHVELAYTHPMVIILQLPLVLVMSVFGGYVFFNRYRKAEVDLWYSKTWIRNQRLAWLFGVLTLLAGMGMIAWGILSMRLILVPLGLLCMFGGLIYPGWRESISAQKIDERYTRLRGAGRPFLNSLPDWRRDRDR